MGVAKAALGSLGALSRGRFRAGGDPRQTRSSAGADPHARRRRHQRRPASCFAFQQRHSPLQARRHAGGDRRRGAVPAERFVDRRHRRHPPSWIPATKHHHQCPQPAALKRDRRWRTANGEGRQGTRRSSGGRRFVQATGGLAERRSPAAHEYISVVEGTGGTADNASPECPRDPELHRRFVGALDQVDGNGETLRNGVRVRVNQSISSLAGLRGVDRKRGEWSCRRSSPSPTSTAANSRSPHRDMSSVSFLPLSDPAALERRPGRLPAPRPRPATQTNADRHGHAPTEDRDRSPYSPTTGLPLPMVLLTIIVAILVVPTAAMALMLGFGLLPLPSPLLLVLQRLAAGVSAAHDCLGFCSDSHGNRGIWRGTGGVLHRAVGRMAAAFGVVVGGLKPALAVAVRKRGGPRRPRARTVRARTGSGFCCWLARLGGNPPRGTARAPWPAHDRHGGRSQSGAIWLRLVLAPWRRGWPCRFDAPLRRCELGMLDRAARNRGHSIAPPLCKMHGRGSRDPRPSSFAIDVRSKPVEHPVSWPPHLAPAQCRVRAARKSPSPAALGFSVSATCLRDQAIAYCAEARRGLARPDSARTGQAPRASASWASAPPALATVMQMVANGYGVTLVPQVAVDVEVRDEARQNCCASTVPQTRPHHRPRLAP